MAAVSAAGNKAEAMLTCNVCWLAELNKLCHWMSSAAYLPFARYPSTIFHTNLGSLILRALCEMQTVQLNVTDLDLGSYMTIKPVVYDLNQIRIAPGQSTTLRGPLVTLPTAVGATVQTHAYVEEVECLHS